MKTAPHHDEWVKSRESQNAKVDKAKYIKEFEDVLCELDLKIPAKHIDLVDNTSIRFLKNTLVYSEGSPAFHHFNISPGAELIHKAGRGFGQGVGCINLFRGLWKWHDVDSNILDHYQDNKKWESELNNVTAEDLEFVEHDFNLFPLQFFDTCDMPETFDAIKHVFKKGKPTLFSLHPITHANTDFYGSIWDKFVETQIVPKGAYLVHGKDTNSFIPFANKVYSANSAVSFTAMLAGKPAATYRVTPWSEILPVIDSATHELLKVNTVPEEDLKRFLSWYYNKFTIDLHSSDWQSKLVEIVEKYNDGKQFEAIFR